MKELKNILTFALLVSLLSSCMENGNPADNSADKPLRYEMKWRVDPVTETHLHIVYEKEYDVQGRLVNFKEFYADGKIEESVNYQYEALSSTALIESYDKLGNKISSVKNEKILDVNGNVVEEKVYNNAGTIENTIKYTYDNNGNVSRKIIFDKNNTVSKDVKYIYTYDKGTVSRRDVFNTSNGSLDSYELIRYGSSSFERTNYNSAGEVEKISSYTYSANGYIKSEIISNKAGDVIEKYLFDYRYF